MHYVLVVHGGAGLIRRASLTPSREAACRAGLEAALARGERVLAVGGSALDAVEAAVVVLEDDPMFNAARGAVLTAEAGAELDAAIMDGRTRRAGAIAGARTPRNPIRLARAVMEHTPHVMLAGAGADAFAVERGLPTELQDYFRTPERLAQLEAALLRSRTPEAEVPEPIAPDVYGTVGAVACDREGHVAAATSTGGTTNKRPGRVGDSPIIGAGTFAWDRTCAVSGTGHGEPFVRLGVASRVSAWMELGGLTLAEAADRVVHGEVLELDGRGGLIAVDATGRIAMPFNTGGMFRGSLRQGEGPVVAIW